MNTMAIEIENSPLETMDSLLQDLAYQNNVCIQLDTNYGAVISYNIMQNDCGLNKNISVFPS